MKKQIDVQKNDAKKVQVVELGKVTTLTFGFYGKGSEWNRRLYSDAL